MCLKCEERAEPREVLSKFHYFPNDASFISGGSSESLGINVLAAQSDQIRDQEEPRSLKRDELH